jgi:hypothetical protein
MPHQVPNPNNYGRWKGTTECPPQAIAPNPYTSLLNIRVRVTLHLTVSQYVLVSSPLCGLFRCLPIKMSSFFFNWHLVSLAIPSLQLRLTTSLFSNLDSTLKTNTQYLRIVQCRVLVLICSHILLRFCLFLLLLNRA